MEAQKNPKRLFDQAIKIRQQSKKHVHILIDEIDMVLNNDGDLSRRVDLALEFQNLMDGVVAYPGITVWGATNHPTRIPAPMLRRFARVMIVGELSAEDRVKTLQHYMGNFLPVSDAVTGNYVAWAERLEGATGDIVRKVVDEVWLRLMREYVKKHPIHAGVLKGTLNDTGVAELTASQRSDIKAHISEKIVVTPELVNECMDHILGNVAVKHQTSVAVATYKTAHQMFDR